MSTREGHTSSRHAAHAAGPALAPGSRPSSPRSGADDEPGSGLRAGAGRRCSPHRGERIHREAAGRLVGRQQREVCGAQHRPHRSLAAAHHGQRAGQRRRQARLRRHRHLRRHVDGSRRHEPAVTGSRSRESRGGGRTPTTPGIERASSRSPRRPCRRPDRPRLRTVYGGVAVCVPGQPGRRSCSRCRTSPPCSATRCTSRRPTRARVHRRADDLEPRAGGQPTPARASSSPTSTPASGPSTRRSPTTGLLGTPPPRPTARLARATSATTR